MFLMSSPLGKSLRYPLRTISFSICLVISLLISLIMGMPSIAASASLVNRPASELPAINRMFVKGADISGTFIPDGGWKIENDLMVGEGRDRWLLADHEIGKGKFDIDVKISMSRNNANYAALQLGAGRIVFGGDAGQLIFRGLPGNDDRVELGAFSMFVEQDEPFRLQVRRRGGKLQVHLNGKKVYQNDKIPQSIGEIGVSPGDGKLTLHHFRAAGDLIEGRRKARINKESLEILSMDDRLTMSLEAGIDFLLEESQNDPEGILGGSHSEAIPGARSLEAYALITAGVDRDHPVVRKHLDHISDSVPAASRIYDVSCWVFALDAAISQAEEDFALTNKGASELSLRKVARSHRKDLQVAAEILFRGQNETGGWRYHVSNLDADTSVTQFVVLALAVLQRRGIKIDPSVWQGLVQYIQSCQEEDGDTVTPEIELEPDSEDSEVQNPSGRRSGELGRGKSGSGNTGVIKKKEIPDPIQGEEMLEAKIRGFKYVGDESRDATWNMSCAGVSSMLVAYEFGAHVMNPETRVMVRESIRDGLAWMQENWTSTDNFYGMYSLEKVGDLGGIKKFGEHDWYDELRTYLLSNQTKEWSWTGGAGYAGRSIRINTAFSLLILKRASAMLTRSSRGFVIYSGGNVLADKDGDRDNWAILSDSGESIHLPTLVRQLRLRPKSRLLLMLEEAVISENRWDRPRFIPHISRVRERVVGRGIHKMLDQILEEIRPTGFEDSDELNAWYANWLRIQEIVIQMTEENSHEGIVSESMPEAAVSSTNFEDEVVNIADASSGDDVMREISIRAAVQLGYKKVVEILIEDLSSKSEDLRILAYGGLRAIFADSPPDFDPSANPKTQKKALDRVAAWARVKS